MESAQFQGNLWCETKPVVHGAVKLPPKKQSKAPVHDFDPWSKVNTALDSSIGGRAGGEDEQLVAGISSLDIKQKSFTKTGLKMQKDGYATIFL